MTWIAGLEGEIRSREGKAKVDPWYEWFLQHLAKEPKVRKRLDQLETVQSQPDVQQLPPLDSGPGA